MSDQNRCQQHDIPKWACGLCAAGSKANEVATGDWEANERARIEAQVFERKRLKEATAKAEAELARQKEERAVVSSLLEKAVAADDTAQEIELRLQIARLDKSTTPVVPNGQAYVSSAPVAPAPAPTEQKANHGRLAFLGYNILIVIGALLLGLVFPLLALVLLPLQHWNIGARLRNIGWQSDGGMTLLWLVGCYVPLVGLILGLTLLFTPGRAA